MRVLCVMALGAALACGQTSTQVFSFAHVTEQQQFQSIADAIRTIAVIDQVSVNTEASSLSVTGTADQLALANWLFHDFDVDPQGPRPDTPEYVVPHAGDDVAHVFYFNGLGPRELQEIVNMMRTIVDVTRIFQNLQANDRSYRKCAGEDGRGANECGGRRTFDKTVSSKPLAFAADAAPMGIDCFSGTRVRVYGHREGSVIDFGGSQYAAAKLVDGRCQRKF